MTVEAAAIIIPAVIGAGGLLTALGNGKEDTVFFGQFIDPFCTYYKFERQYNDVIDKILMDRAHGHMGYKIPISEKLCIPGEGIHHYYKKRPQQIKEIVSLNRFNRVAFYKKIKSSNNIETITYYCRKSPILKLFKNNAFDQILKKIFNPNDNMMRITSIDTSTMEPKLIVKNQIFKNPTHIQKAIAKCVLDEYFNPINNNNVKIFITGQRGTQKTYMGKIIKNMLDNHKFSDGRICATLIDNFNPKDIGVNIETMILHKASKFNPIITVINEFDIIMNYVIDDNKQCFDPRLCHAKDKATFNAMLDNIGDTKYSITIFTAETSVKELESRHEDFKSFVRKGRMDFHAEMRRDWYNIIRVEE